MKEDEGEPQEDASATSIYTTLTKRIAKLEENLAISTTYVEQMLTPKLTELGEKMDSRFAALESRLGKPGHVAFNHTAAAGGEASRNDSFQALVQQRIEKVFTEHNTTLA